MGLSHGSPVFCVKCKCLGVRGLLTLRAPLCRHALSVFGSVPKVCISRTSGLVSNLLPYRDDSNRKEYREIKILGIVQYINCIIFASN